MKCLLMICLFIGPVLAMHAQDGNLMRNRGLQVGDAVPPVHFSLLLNHTTRQAKLSEFKGKLVILDFWATWCSPCIKMIPVMDSLQTRFRDKVQFLAVTYQDEATVSKFLQQYTQRYGAQKSIPLITGDTALTKLFYHNQLPHYVWIDNKGVVQAITDMKAVTAENISSLLAHNKLTAREKRDAFPMPYSYYRPLLLDRNGGDGATMIYHSLFTGFTEGLGFGYSILRDSTPHFRITMRNSDRARFYMVAYSTQGRTFNEFNTLLDVADTGRITSKKVGAEYEDWLKDNNGFCYELAVPLTREKEAFPLMQRDLALMFPEYTAGIEKAARKCLVLRRTDTSIDLRTKGGKPEIKIDPYETVIRNGYLRHYITRVNNMQRFSRTVIDETGYTERVDVHISEGFSDVNAMNNALKRYGLVLEEADREVELLVIRDRLPGK